MKKIIFGILVLVAFVVSGCELIENDPQKAGLRPYLVGGGGGGGGSGSYCTDSDGGLDYYTWGDCVDSHHASPMNDGCIESNGDNDGFLREITCDDRGNGVMCQMNDYECPYGCFQGVCLYDPLEVTYQGVLDMLNGCVVEKYVGGSADITCDQICGEQTCISGLFSEWKFDFGGVGNNVVDSKQVNCNEDIYINPPDLEHLYCTCCEL